MGQWRRWVAALVVVALAECVYQVECTVTFVAPEGGNGTASNTVMEGSTSGTVYTLNATSDNGSVTYNLTSQSVAGTFEVASAGDVTVASGAVIDYETRTEHLLIIVGVDDTTTSTASLTIMIEDKNDNTPAFSKSTYLYTAAAASPAGTSIGTPAATDNDGSAPNNVITYEITGGVSNMTFKIDNSTGEISVASGQSLASESGTAYTIEVTATDNGTPPRSVTATMMVGVCKGATAGVASTVGNAVLLLLCALMAVARQQ